MTKLSEEEKAADREWRAGARGPGSVAIWCAYLAGLGLLGGFFATVLSDDGTFLVIGVASCIQLLFVRVAFRWMEARYNQTERMIQLLEEN